MFVLMSVMCSPVRPAVLAVAVGQHAIGGGKSIPVPTHSPAGRHVHSRVGPTYGIVHRAGKSVIQMLLRGPQMTAGGL